MLHPTYASSAEKSLQQHFRGRGHLKGLERQRVGQKSVYIRGFPSDTTTDTLKMLLEEKVGQVHWLQLNKVKEVFEASRTVMVVMVMVCL